jgi:ribosome maturation protein SDO1
MIFVNVSKGQVAKAEAVEKCFGTAKTEDVLVEILRRGELQVGEKEREAALTKIRREIATALANMSVNPTTMRPYPMTILEKAMKEVHFKPDAKKPAKRQALDLLTQLQATMPIERAKMRLKLECTGSVIELLEREGLVSAIEGRTDGSDNVSGVEVVVLIEPGCFRAVDDAVQRNGGRVTVLSLAALREGDAVEGTDGEGIVRGSSNPVACATGGDGDNASPHEDVQVAPATTKPVPASRRAQRGQVDMNALLGVVDDDSSEDWKKKGATKGGKKKKGKGKK